MERLIRADQDAKSTETNKDQLAIARDHNFNIMQMQLVNVQTVIQRNMKEPGSMLLLFCWPLLYICGLDMTRSQYTVNLACLK